jgi:hypothetical protein
VQRSAWSAPAAVRMRTCDALRPCFLAPAGFGNPSRFTAGVTKQCPCQFFFQFSFMARLISCF